MREIQCMTFKKMLSTKPSFKPPLVFCLLAAFLPLGSTFGVLLSWFLFPCIAILLTVLHSRRFQLYGVFFFIFSSLLLLFNYAIVVQYVTFKERLEFNMFLAIIGSFYMSVVLYSDKFNFKDLTKAIDVILFINIALFLVQFLAFYIFSYRVDYSSLTGGVGTRNDYGILFRASGIFNEPAEYSAAMTVLVVVRFLINRKLNKLSVLSLITTILSFSFVGIIQSFSVLFLILSRNFYKKPSYFLWAIFLSILGGIIFLDMFIERYTAFIDGSDGSNNTKLDTINFFLTNSEYLTGGAGLIGYDPLSMPLFMQGLYDLTFFGSSITIFGIYIGIFINILLIGFIIRNYRFLDAALIFICLLKINVMIYAMYWFFIILVLKSPFLDKSVRIQRAI